MHITPIITTIDNHHVLDLYQREHIIYIGSAPYKGLYTDRDARRYVLNGIDAVMWAWLRITRPEEMAVLGFRPDDGQRLSLYLGSTEPLHILAAYLFEHPASTEKSTLHNLLEEVARGTLQPGNQQMLIAGLHRFYAIEPVKRTRRNLQEAFWVIDAFANDDPQFAHIAADHTRSSNSELIARPTPARRVGSREPIAYGQRTPFAPS